MGWCRTCRGLDEHSLRAELVQPLLEQVAIDAGPLAYQLTAGELSPGGTVPGVTEQSLRLGLTRSRIYQLRDIPSLVIETRWAEGFLLWQSVLERCESAWSSNSGQPLLTKIGHLFFSSKREAYWQAFR